MNCRQSVDAFNLDYYAVLNEEVNTIAAFQFYRFITDRQGMLALVFYFSEIQFAGKTLFITRFKQPGTEVLMNFHGTTDYLL